MKNNCQNGVITIYVDLDVFDKATIIKCTYWYADKFHVNISDIDSKIYKVELTPISNSKIKDDSLDFYQSKFERDLIDFSLRQIVNSETKIIRELIINKAFAHGEFEL